MWTRVWWIRTREACRPTRRNVRQYRSAPRRTVVIREDGPALLRGPDFVSAEYVGRRVSTGSRRTTSSSSRNRNSNRCSRSMRSESWRHSTADWRTGRSSAARHSEAQRHAFSRSTKHSRRVPNAWECGRGPDRRRLQWQSRSPRENRDPAGPPPTGAAVPRAGAAVGTRTAATVDEDL